MKRSTTDIVVILFTLMIGITIVIGSIGLVIGRILHPEADIARGVELLGNVLTTIVGALVGFIGGRATGRAENNNDINAQKH